ncbi:flagellin N-terminal helical domain-containing protein [Neorhodopirellula pilleata]|uniref:Flagellin n=1 Tax=Neorhodopirellula pilleata TaxID=2714738 RepID=A0A5C6AGR5_9BACT|nr:flagellin [Neorhodopirellula pilleata]TWT97403.1 B-type flagellin [Neorhodopirellula pilleata]
MTRINTNVPSLVAQNRLQSSNNDLQQALTRLSTGLRINSGSDDPAGLIASEALRSEITSLGKAISNTRRASQIISTADSALGQVSNLLNDVRGLVVEAANTGALSEDEVAANQLQIDSSLEAINRIAQTTTFQGRKLLSGDLDFLTKAGTNFNNITNLQVDQANLGAIGSLDVSVTVTAAAEQASITIPSIPAAIAPATSAGSVDLQRVITADAASGSLVFTQANPQTEAASGAVTVSLDDGGGGTPGGDFTLTTKAGGAFEGALGEGLDVVIATTAAAGGTASTIVEAAGTVTITLEEGQTLAQIATFLGADADFEFATTDVSANVVAATSAITSGPAALAGGADASTSTATIAVTATADGEDFNGDIIFDESTPGATFGVAVNVDGDIVVTIDPDTDQSLASIASAINDLADFDAVLTNGDTIPVGDYDGGTSTAPTITNLTGGVDAATLTASINLTAKSTGADANTNTITFQTTATVGPPTATVDTDGNITITVQENTDVDLDDIITAITDEGTYDAEVEAGNTLTAFNSGTDTDTENAFAGGLAASGGLAKSVVFELLGKSGSEVFNVSAGTGIDDLITQINLVQDATGVTASKDGQDLILTSTEYGSDAIVDLRVIQEDDGGTIKTSPIGAGRRVTGQDIKAKVNGVDANGRGNTLSINTATLDISITVKDGSDDSVGFTINGGGALFQLGADVVSNQQARIGIGSVSTARLGGPAGRLFQLGSGESASLANDPNLAAKIVTDAIDQVTGIRGRLGAFQATTLESNIVSLNDTLANLQEAESSIRDADFAQESANLTRAQILVQSGTNVLSLANQNPQNVLSLLR